MEDMLTPVEGVRERMRSEKLGIESMYTLLDSSAMDRSQEMASGIDRTKERCRAKGRLFFFFSKYYDVFADIYDLVGGQTCLLRRYWRLLLFLSP